MCFVIYLTLEVIFANLTHLMIDAYSLKNLRLKTKKQWVFIFLDLYLK